MLSHAYMLKSIYIKRDSSPIFTSCQGVVDVIYSYMVIQVQSSGNTIFNSGILSIWQGRFASFPCTHGQTCDEGFIGRIERMWDRVVKKKNRGQNNGRIIKYCVPSISILLNGRL